MPKNNNIILNEGILFSTREVNMSKEICLLQAVINKSKPQYIIKTFDDNICGYTSETITNENPKQFPPRIQYWMNKDDEFSVNEQIYWKKHRKKSWMQFQREHKELIFDYLDLIPFYPCIMINISPNWKGKHCDKYARKLTIPKFIEIIDKYLNTCNRYSKWKYVIESGGDDNFIHCHIVAEWNKDCIKSTETHIRKGNHFQEIRKIWDKTMPEGKKGMLKGKFAIQSTILRNEQLRDDKYAYLIEENKPEGHKNKVDLGLLFEGSLITSKE